MNESLDALLEGMAEKRIKSKEEFLLLFLFVICKIIVIFFIMVIIFIINIIIIREKREWDEKRRGVLFAYERDSYFSSSSALALYELAWRISRDTNDLLW